MFFELFGAYLEEDAVGSTKGCARVFHYKMQRMTKVIQKLDFTHRICALWVKETQTWIL